MLVDISQFIYLYIHIGFYYVGNTGFELVILLVMMIKVSVTVLSKLVFYDQRGILYTKRHMTLLGTFLVLQLRIKGCYWQLKGYF